MVSFLEGCGEGVWPCPLLRIAALMLRQCCHGVRQSSTGLGCIRNEPSLTHDFKTVLSYARHQVDATSNRFRVEMKGMTRGYGSKWVPRRRTAVGLRWWCRCPAAVIIFLARARLLVTNVLGWFLMKNPVAALLPDARINDAFNIQSTQHIRDYELLYVH